LNPDRKQHTGLSTAVLIALVILICWSPFFSGGFKYVIKQDFIGFYVAARMALDGELSLLHDPEVFSERQKALGRTDFLPFARPHFYAALLSPVGLLDFPYPAFSAWVVTFSLLLIATVVLAVRRWGPDALVMTAFSGAAMSIFIGHETVFLLLALTVSYLLAERGRLLSAGAVLALVLAKFHLLLLFPVLLIMQRRFRLFAGFCVTGLVLVALSAWLGGWQGVGNYVDLLLSNNEVEYWHPEADRMPNLWSMPLSWGLPQAAHLPFSIIACALAVAAVMRATGSELWRLYALGTAGSLLVAPHTWWYDFTLMLLPVWLIYQYSRNRVSRIAAVLIASPVPFALSVSDSPLAASIETVILVVLVAAECFDSFVGPRQTTPESTDTAPPSEPASSAAAA
jgi:hypothetical protein